MPTARRQHPPGCRPPADAYDLRVEWTADDHPVSLLAVQRADDDVKRRTSLDHLHRLVRDQGGEVSVVGYHDLTELPVGYPLPG